MKIFLRGWLLFLAVEAAVDLQAQMEPRPHMGAKAGTEGAPSAMPSCAGQESPPPNAPLLEGKHTIEPWGDLPPHQRHGIEAPYVPPADRIYKTSAGPVEGKINVHLVPHSHDDTGWLVTVDQYFSHQVYYVIDTVVNQLLADPNRRFMFVETSFFARWWEEQPEWRQNETKVLVNQGRLEFINGGWCMHDEAAPHYVEMVDQTTRGHQWLLKHFGASGAPKGTWQIDPFGHSNTAAWLLGAEAGMQSMYWGRMDFQDFNVRKAEKRLEWVWQPSQSLGDSARIFTGQLFGSGGGGYGTHINFNTQLNQIQDNPRRHDYNVDKWVDKFVRAAMDQASHTQTDHQLWATGSDFNYQNADHWYHNLDKLIHHVNLNGTVNAFYSTPSFYTEQKNKAGSSWELRHDDIFPLADNAHNYWSGYFTSRPTLKKQVRVASGVLNAARQLEVLSGVSKEEVATPTTRPSPEVGDSWTDSLEGTVGVATHHDGMSGTSRQAVANDYAQRMSESHLEVEVGVGLSLQRLLGTTQEFGHCNCNIGGDCLNISMCPYTASRDAFTVVAWNSLGQSARSLLRLPVVGPSWSVASADGPLDSQVAVIDERTQHLPLLYVNHHGLTPEQIQEQEALQQNSATHILSFFADMPAVGYASFTATKSEEPNLVKEKHIADDPVRVSNGVYELTFDPETNTLSEIRNLKSNVSSRMNINWGFYRSSPIGGCTPGVSLVESCSIDASGAYIFRPNTEHHPSAPWSPDAKARAKELFYPGPSTKPTLKVIEGDVAVEIHQNFSEWVTHVIRLAKGEPYIEVEYTVGPIPKETPWVEGNPNWGKEIVVRYDTDLDSDKEFFTDSNGREMVRRVRDARGPSYPEYKVAEPVASNYYPIGTTIALNDGKAELAVLTEVAQGGSSMSSGSLELMVHRRNFWDDTKGVFETMDETMCGCRQSLQHPFGACDCAPLTIRGRHWLVLDEVSAAHEARRALSESQNFPPMLAFTEAASTPPLSTFTALAMDLPRNVKFQTLTSNYASIHDGRVLLRLTHLYEAGEHPTLSRPVALNLGQVFGNGYSIVAAEEMGVTANQGREEMESKKLDWDVYDVTGGAVLEQLSRVSAEDRRIPMTDDMEITIRPMEVKTYLVSFVSPHSVTHFV